MTDAATIAGAVTPVLTSLGLVLYDVELGGSGRARLIRVLVDRDGGADLDAIAAASEALGPVLDSAQGADASYVLEVSSPGLERPLRRPEHFRSAVGSPVSVKFRVGDTPARRVRGVLVAAGDDACELAIDDGSSETIRYRDVAAARTVFEWVARR